MRQTIRSRALHPVLALWAGILVSAAHAAEPGKVPIPSDVPPALHPWAAWVLHGHETESCPFLAAGDRRECIWPGALELSLDEKGGRFQQRFSVYAESSVPLLGDEKRWPQNVTANGAPVALVPRDGRPSLLLAPGHHVVSGTFVWDALPEELPVPPQAGLLALTVRNQRVAYPTRDESGVVWLQKKAGEGDTENALDVVVHRKVVDEIPLVVETRISLRIAGKSREELLGRALPEHLSAMSLVSPLPARLDPDGRLRVQARPGNYTLTLTARHEGPAESLGLGQAGGPWADEEVWVFDARPHLRQVIIDGVPALDPTQTTLPDDWKRLPGYRVRPGEAMRFEVKQRGDTNPAPDELSLMRTLWLDVEGNGYSFSDQLTGRLSRSWRLAMASPAELGRVSVSGQDVLITRLSPNDPAGVEVRQGSLQLTAEGRIEGARATLPAVGWTSDLASAGAQLNLPPGWRLLAAFGADSVPSTWISGWNLLELFLLLITTLATARLFGWRAGLVAFLTLALIIPEGDAPTWAWLPVLACEALVRVLPEMWLRKALRAARVASLGTLAMLTLLFAIHQVRVGMYPVLQMPGRSMGEGGGAALVVDTAPSPPDLVALKKTTSSSLAPLIADGEARGHAEEEPEEAKSEQAYNQSSRRPAKAKAGWTERQFNYEYDTKTTVQTGKGLPRWTWNQASIRWSGPVDHGQTLTLLLLPPGANRVLAFVRVVLSILLLVIIASSPGSIGPHRLRRLFTRAAPAAGALFLVASLAATPSSARAQEDNQEEVKPPQASPGPDNGLLDQLRERLLTPPKCLPSCASIARLSLDIASGRLRGRLSAHAQVETGVPLPGSSQTFVPDQVLLDGKPATLLRAQDGVLWALVPAGVHEILLEGPLPSHEIVAIPLPLKPRRVEAHAEGYSVEGIHEDGLADDNLQLSRVRGKGEAAGSNLAPGQLPPFVRVERTLSLGLSWQASTRVVRLTPPGAAVVLEVPLLPGEQVTSAEVRVAGGKALVNMAPQATEAEWLSALEVNLDKPLVLKASTASFVESWRLEASPLWHVGWEGIPTVHPSNQADRTPQWRPWPGESVTLTVHKPEAVPGQTLTVNRSELTVKPGVRSTESELQLVLRSSRGGQHPVRLPGDAELTSVAVNGQLQPIRQEKDRVSLPLVPGEQRVALTFRQPVGASALFRSPPVDVGLASVNADHRIEVPRERWILFAGGAPAGPAVLFWSLLVVLLIVAIVLSKTGYAPLSLPGWMLLAAGLTQVPVAAAAIPVAWLLLLEWRKRTPEMTRWFFNLRQAGLLLVTIAALFVLAVSIHEGLLGLPDMQVEGNGSTESTLRWFVDRSPAALPRPWVVSVPLVVFRAVMLAWALWIAWSLLSWLKWGFGAFTEGGAWKRAATKPGQK